MVNLLVNHYEINCIHDSYLVLWSNNPEREFITINQLRSAYVDLKEELLLSLFDTGIFYLYLLYVPYRRSIL